MMSVSQRKAIEMHRCAETKLAQGVLSHEDHGRQEVTCQIIYVCASAFVQYVCVYWLIIMLHAAGLSRLLWQGPSFVLGYSPVDCLSWQPFRYQVLII